MGLIFALIIFSLIVLIHEFGHFIVAKKNGVKIYEFAIGMGPKVFGKQKGDTLYSIRLFPIGGYVRMAGEECECDECNSEDYLSKKSLLARASIVFAGPFINIVVAIISFTIIYMLIGFNTTTVNKIYEGSLAANIGMQKGDQILYINDKKINTFEDMSQISPNEDGTIDFVVKRNGEEKKLTIKEVTNNILGVEVVNEKNLIKSISKGFSTTANFAKEMTSSLWKLATGWINKNEDTEKIELSGPVGIVNIISDAVETKDISFKTKVVSIFNLFGQLSLNLGIINLIPFPALDGSRLLFMFIEFIRGGKKVNPNIENLLYLVGFLLLMIFMICITVKDVIRLF